MFSSVKPGQRLAVVQLQLLQQRQIRVLRLFQPRQHRPHRRHFDGVRSDVLAFDFFRVVVLLVDLDFIRQPRDVRDVDLDGTIAQCFHELVVLQASVLRLVRVSEDDFVDVGLREFLRLDLVFLAGAQQVVQERHVQFQDFDELDDAAIGDVELAVKVERPRIAVGAVLGDLAIVDVAGQFRRVLVLLVLRLKRADADAILLR